MMLQFGNNQNILSIQSARFPRMAGQIQNLGVQKIVQQINANYANHKNRDTVVLSQKAQNLLNTTKKQQTYTK